MIGRLACVVVAFGMATVAGGAQPFAMRCQYQYRPRPNRQRVLPAHAANGEPAVWFYSRGC